MNQHFLKTLPAAVALALSASAAQAALPIDFGGYIRSGFGTSSEGGKEACFGLAGASSKYRLGNECETYGELKFGGEAFKAANGTTFRINTLVAFSVNQNQDWEQSDPSWREMNVVADKIGTGAFAAGAEPGAQVAAEVDRQGGLGRRRAQAQGQRGWQGVHKVSAHILSDGFYMLSILRGTP